MRQAQAKLGPERPLNRDIGLSCKQEANHYLQHGAFNETMHRAGYDRVSEIEAISRTTSSALLGEKLLTGSCAYTLGFETPGPVSFQLNYRFQHDDELARNADPTVVAMCKWHHAKEPRTFREQNCQPRRVQLLNGSPQIVWCGFTSS